MYKLAKDHKPKLIVTGGSAYPRVYEWAKYKEVADSVGAFLMADMSHVAGLCGGWRISVTNRYCRRCYNYDAQNFAWSEGGSYSV